MVTASSAGRIVRHRSRATWAAILVGVVLASGGFPKTARADDDASNSGPEQPSLAWFVVGGALLGATVALETSSWRDAVTQAGPCDAWGCGIKLGTASLVEPLAVGLIAVGAFQQGDVLGAQSRYTDRARDHATMRTVGIVTGLASYAVKVGLAGYMAITSIACFENARSSACAGHGTADAALVNLVLTAPLTLGAIMGGYGQGFEHGRAGTWNTVTFGATPTPGGGRLFLALRF